MAETSNFNYSDLIDELINQVDNITPDDLNVFEKKYVKNSIKEFSTIAAKYMYENLDYSSDKCAVLTQITAEWTFHKCIDLMRSTVPQNYWDAILQKINFTIFEIFKICEKNSQPHRETINLIEYGVNECYTKCIEELKDKNCIDDETFANAIIQSNIDSMANNFITKPSIKEIIVSIISKIIAIGTSFIILFFAIIPNHLTIWDTFSSISLIAISTLILYRSNVVAKSFYLHLMFWTMTCIFVNKEFLLFSKLSIYVDLLIISLAAGAFLGYKIGQKKTEL